MSDKSTLRKRRSHAKGPRSDIHIEPHTRTARYKPCACCYRASDRVEKWSPMKRVGLLIGGVILGALVLVIVILTIVAVALRDVDIKGITDCEGGMFSWLLRAIPNRCATDGSDVNDAFNDAGRPLPMFFYRYLAPYIRGSAQNFGGVVLRSLQNKDLGLDDAAVRPFCFTNLTSESSSFNISAKDAEGATLIFVGNDDQRRRFCARVLYAVTFPKADIFGGTIDELFSGSSACAKKARGDHVGTTLRILYHNCADEKVRDLADYLWVYPRNTTRIFSGTCTSPTDGGHLVPRGAFMKHTWCNDMFAVLQNANLSSIDAQQSIVHHVLHRDLPACEGAAYRTLWNSYNASCAI